MLILILNKSSVFILLLFNVSSRKPPKASSPTVPQKYASAPNFEIAAATFAGAPPAFFIKPSVAFNV